MKGTYIFPLLPISPGRKRPHLETPVVGGEQGAAAAGGGRRWAFCLLPWACCLLPIFGLPGIRLDEEPLITHSVNIRKTTKLFT